MLCSADRHSMHSTPSAMNRSSPSRRGGLHKQDTCSVDSTLLRMRCGHIGCVTRGPNQFKPKNGNSAKHQQVPIRTSKGFLATRTWSCEMGINLFGPMAHACALAVTQQFVVTACVGQPGRAHFMHVLTCPACRCCDVTVATPLLLTAPSAHCLLGLGF